MAIDRRSGESTNPQGLGVVAAGAAAALFGIAGVAFLTLVPGGTQWGYTLFLLLPFATGMAAGTALAPQRMLGLTVALTLASGVVGLLLAGIEGTLCCLFALPLILPGVLIGGLTAKVCKARARAQLPTSAVFLGLALSVLAADSMERRLLPQEDRFESVDSAIVLDAPRREAWDGVLNFPRLSASEASTLFELGLPRPNSCVTEGSGVGARRVCYYEEGAIEQRVTRWQPPDRLDVRVTSTTIPGRPWLTLGGASYELSSSGAGTDVRRVTEFGSRLRPNWYWRRLEAIAVTALHNYAFADLQRRTEAPTNVAEDANYVCSATAPETITIAGRTRRPFSE